MSAITTHVLDTARGKPAAGVPITLGLDGRELGRGVTDADGRLRTLLPAGPLIAGVYTITFDTATYFASIGTEGLYPDVSIRFHVRGPGEHYHIPLLISPYGYSTYRGS